MKSLNIVCGHYGELEFEQYGDMLQRNKDLLEIISSDDTGHYIETNLKGYPSLLYLLHNPIADNYWLCYEDKTPIGFVDYASKTVLCHKHKFSALIVPKNACSSIVQTALIHDKVMKKPLDIHEKIWDNKELTPKRVHPTSGVAAKKLKNYKMFAVVSNPYDRFLRFINHNQYKRYCNKFRAVGDNWTKSQAIDEYLWALQYITKNNIVWDDHAVLQSTIICNAEKWMKASYEYVPLKGLGEWFEKNFGKFYKNNVSTEKIFTLDDFNSDQRKRLDEYLEPDFEYLARKYINST